MQNNYNSAHFKKGTKNEIAFVFSCPGQKEEYQNEPASGATGNNLNIVLKILSEDYHFLNCERDSITITNAWKEVEYMSKTRRSEASDKEILGLANLNRLKKELGGIRKYIFVCGNKARIALEAITHTNGLKNISIICLPHLGNRAISQISKDINGMPIKSYEKAKDKPSSETRSLRQIRLDNKKLRLQKVLSSGFQNLQTI